MAKLWYTRQLEKQVQEDLERHLKLLPHIRGVAALLEIVSKIVQKRKNAWPEGKADEVVCLLNELADILRTVER